MYSNDRSINQQPVTVQSQLHQPTAGTYYSYADPGTIQQKPDHAIL
ncbi:hypothetical protein [Endozoicomonas montiporae]|nr:hypothetical protein [Endozoicomonas montiporae]